MSRTVAFPHVKRFADLFDQVEVAPLYKSTLQPNEITGQELYVTRKGEHKTRKVPVEIGPFCALHHTNGYRHVYARATPTVMKHLQQNWVGDSPGTFKVVVRDDGTALVLVEYSRILGSHWLALVDASTVPEGL